MSQVSSPGREYHAQVRKVRSGSACLYNMLSTNVITIHLEGVSLLRTVRCEDDDRVAGLQLIYRSFV